MIPELAYHYGLAPDDVWEMSQTQWNRFMEHHKRLGAEDGRP